MNTIIIKTYKNHSIWNLDLKSQKIQIETEFDKKDNMVSIIPQKGYWYCSAINEENAMRKFNTMAQKVLAKLKSENND